MGLNGVKKPWRLASLLVSGSAVAAAATFLASVVLARWLGPAQQGVYVVLLIYPTLLAALFQMGIWQASARAVGQRERPLGTVLGTVAMLWLVGGGLGALIVVVLVATGTQAVPVWAVILAAVLVPLNNLQAYLGGLFIGTRSIGRYSLVSSLIAVAFLAMVAGMALTMPARGEFALLARCMAMAMAMVVLLSLLRGAIADRLDHTQGEVMGPLRVEGTFALLLLRRGASYGMALFLADLHYRVGLLTLEHWSDPAQIGLFHVADRSAQLLWELPLAFGILAFSDSANARSAVDDGGAAFQRTNGGMRQAIYVTAAAGVLGIVLAPWVFPLVFGADYRDSALVFVLLVPGVVGMAAYKVGNAYFAGIGRPLLVIPAILIGLGVNVGLCWWAVPRYGATGAAAAVSCGLATTAVVFMLVWRRHARSVSG